MCPPPYLYPSALDVMPANVGGEIVPDLYDLRFCYEGSQDWQHLLGVHVPKVVQKAFSEGQTAGFNLAFLELNSPAALSFSHQPRYVVMAVEFHDGTRLPCVPKILRQKYWRHVVLIALSLLVGSGLALVLQSLFAAAVTGALVVHHMHIAARIPRKSRWSQTRHRSRNFAP